MAAANSSLDEVECNSTFPQVNSSFFDDWLETQKYPGEIVDRTITPIWYIVGITGNIISAIIWLRRRMRRNNSSAVYLATLSINDTVFLLLHILQELKYAWKLRTVDYPVICEMYAFVYLMTQYLAPTLVLGFTVERFIAVCYPYQKNRYCTASRALKVSLSMIGGCLTLATMQLYLWTYDSDKNECSVRTAAQTGGEHSLWAIWSWITEMLIFFAVPLLILIVNILVMREVCRMSNATVEAAASRHKLKPSKSAATNAMLLSVSFYMIFTTLPATLVYVLSSAFPDGPSYDRTDCRTYLVPLADMIADPKWRRSNVYFIVRKTVDEICLSHYACNFFMFVITGLEFRLELRRTLRLARVCVWRDVVEQENGGHVTEYSSSRVHRNSFRSAEESHTFVTKL